MNDYIVKEDGIYKLVCLPESCESAERLALLKDVFVKAFKKYIAESTSEESRNIRTAIP